MTALPANWLSVTLREVAEINPGHSQEEISDDQLVTFLPMPAIEAETGNISRQLTRRWASVKKGYTHFRDGDVLFAKITPCMENGKVAVCSDLLNGVGTGSTEFHVVRPVPSILECKYLFFYLLQRRIRSEARAVMRGAAGQLRVPLGFLLGLRIPLPPLSEQRRIVAEIEKQFTRLDQGVRTIDSVARKVRRAQGSIFASALKTMESDLRAPVAESTWLNPVVGAMSADKVLPDPNFRLLNPGSWAIKSLDQITTRITSGSRDWSPYYGRGTGTFLLAQNIRPRKLDLNIRQPVDPPLGDASRNRSVVQFGDVLVTIVGANTGDVCAIHEYLNEHYVCQSVALLRPITWELTKYLVFYLSDNFFGRRIWNRYMYGAGRPHLSFEQLKRTPIPIPSRPLLERLTLQMESLETIVVATQKTLVEGRTRAARLRQAILAKAFSGQLVPQDPNDEPASVLLERIRAERSLIKPKPTPRKRSSAQRELTLQT